MYACMLIMEGKSLFTAECENKEAPRGQPIQQQFEQFQLNHSTFNRPVLIRSFY